jgi:LIVCS family branched-chain amino acid:cation transporter
MKFFNKDSWAVGLAMFSMFFGAGNIIFPLAIGQMGGDKNLVAILGLILTGVIVPFIGVYAMIKYEGDKRKFFGKMGKVPGFLVAFLTILLLGPLGSSPRCIALAHTTLQSFLPKISIYPFAFFSCVVIYFCAVSKKRLLSLLGIFLTPLLLISLITIIVLGFVYPSDIMPVKTGGGDLFFTGLKEGYNTMDLLAAFFFSSTIWSLLKTTQDKNKIALQASLIAMTLLILIYLGFSFIAAMHGGDLMRDEILSKITFKLMGPYAGVFVCLAIGLACLTTAVALISAFTDFLEKEVFKGKIRYKLALIFSLAMTFIVATLKFQGISAFLGPILEIIYPALIILTIVNALTTVKKEVYL